MLKRRFIINEIILSLGLAYQILNPELFAPDLSLITFFLYEIAVYCISGLRLTAILFFIAEILVITSNVYLHISALILIASIIIFFPIYTYPEPSGPYKVGCRDTLLDEKPFAVFYPTEEITQDITNHPHDEVGDRFYEVQVLYHKFYSKKNFIPRIFYKTFVSYLEYLPLGVNFNAKLLDKPENSEGFPVIIFSPGLSANRFVYSFLLKEWASHGYIVFSLEHYERIVPEFSTYPEYINQRREHVLVRKQQGISALDFVYNKEKVEELFEKQVKIDKSRILMSGHSLGASTAVESSLFDKRITGGILLLDPWIDPCDPKMYETSLDIPILTIRTHEYENIDFVTKIVKDYLKGSNKDKNLTISGYYKGSKHNSFTDLIFHMPREMILFGLVHKKEDLGKYIFTYNQFVLSFLKIIKNNKLPNKLNVKKLVMEDYKNSKVDEKFKLEYVEDILN